jgi:elongation factor Ts
VVKDFVTYNLDATGLIEGYLHFGGRVGVLVEVKAADTLSDTAALSNLAHDLALHIAASRPRFINRNEVSEDVINQEKSVLMAQLAEDNKPDHIKERIVEGRLNKFYQENCLLDQAFVKDDSLSIADLVAQHSKKLGTALSISRFTRYEIGNV